MVEKFHFVTVSLIVTPGMSAGSVSEILNMNSPRGVSAALNWPLVMNMDYWNNMCWTSLQRQPVIEPSSWINNEDDINYAEWLVARQHTGSPHHL